MQGLGIGDANLGLEVWGSGFKFLGEGFRVQFLEFKVYGFGFGV